MGYIQTEYIGTGEYYIGKGERKLLKALLGSCVGVAVFDKVAGIGGVIHLLLPEHTGLDTDWLPESYASTGLPLFIEQLFKTGAEQKRLEAVVAGGALFGGVSKHDLNLNIGGRTIEKVLEVLNRYHIPILKEETGGFHPSVLELDTSSLKANIITRFDSDTDSPDGQSGLYKTGPGDTYPGRGPHCFE